MYTAPPTTAVVQITHLAYIWDVLGFSLSFWQRSFTFKF